MSNTIKNVRLALFAALAAVFLILGAAPQSLLAAEAITEANVAEKLSVASTAADHEALAAYFTEQAKQAAKQVALHENMRSRQSGKSRARMNQHCRDLIRAFRAEQEAYEDLATLQTDLAKEAGQ